MPLMQTSVPTVNLNSSCSTAWQEIADRASKDLQATLGSYGWEMRQALEFGAVANLIERPHLTASGKIATLAGLVEHLGLSADRGEEVVGGFVRQGLLAPPTAHHLPYSLSDQGRRVSEVISTAAGMFP